MSRIIKSRLGSGIPAGKVNDLQSNGMSKGNGAKPLHNLGRGRSPMTNYGVGILPVPTLIFFPLGDSLPINFSYGVPLAITNVSQYDNLNVLSRIERYRSDSDNSSRSSMTRLNARYYWDLDHDAR